MTELELYAFRQYSAIDATNYLFQRTRAELSVICERLAIKTKPSDSSTKCRLLILAITHPARNKKAAKDMAVQTSFLD